MRFFQRRGGQPFRFFVGGVSGVVVVVVGLPALLVTDSREEIDLFDGN
jgi:hypothetical protein